jgi:uncharacterized protein (TIGR02001 family)
MKTHLGLIFASTLALLGTAAAQDVIKAEPEAAALKPITPEAVQTAIDLAFGVASTSNYVSRGLTNSDDKAAFQAYMEASYGIAYAGAWGSSVDFGDDDNLEVDVYAGIRPEFGKLALDVGYARYFYNVSGDAGGEAYAKANYAMTDTLSFGGEAFQNFDTKQTYLRAKASYVLPENFTLSGGFGRYAQINQKDWDIGISHTFADDKVKLDLRYYGYKDATDVTHKIVAAISLDSSLSLLGGN